MEEEEEACLCGWLRPDGVERGGETRVGAPGPMTRPQRTLPWLWLPDQVHCGSRMPSAAGGPVGGVLEAAGTRAMVVAPPERRKEEGNKSI